ncbi:MAG TPA: hypothetical protein VKT80_07395 [Chloroflexota bacterium]|nr:hypothetical protein [Chloroflexota bacterium]
MIVPWEAVDAFVAADRQFVAAVRDAADRLRSASPPDADLVDWLVLRVAEIDRTHREILVAETELRTPTSGQSMDWLVLRMHHLTGDRQTLGVSYNPNWNSRVSDVVDASAPELAVVLNQATSAVSVAAAKLNRAFFALSLARKEDPYQDRESYSENHDRFWERRDESGNYHIWNGVTVPIDAPNRAAAIYFAGEADGYVLHQSLPMSLRDPGGSRWGGSAYGSLLGTGEERRQQLTEALDRSREPRVALGIALYHGSLPLLSRDEGIFGTWWLTDQQFADLQGLCEAHGWPTDLWVPDTPCKRYG